MLTKAFLRQDQRTGRRWHPHQAATFVGIDPAIGMLEVCGQRLDKASALPRCELIHGYVQDVPQGECFDVVLSILVAHFVKHEDRPNFYQAM